MIRNLICIFSGFLVACSGILYPDFSIAQPSPILLESIEMYPALEGDTLEIRYDRPFAFVTYTLKEPDRLVLDPVEPLVHSAFDLDHKLNGVLVRGWKIVPPAGSHEPDQVDYLSFELTEPSEHLVELANGRLLLRFRSRHSIQPFALRPTAFGTTTTVTQIPGIEPDPSRQPWTLDQALVFGLGRHRPIRVARQEVVLAQMKVREARRALYPAAKLRFSWTQGTASNIDFDEYQTGVQLEHPLYYSGRLKETYRQSLVNLKVAEKRRTKVKSDFTLEVAEVYYELIGAEASLKAQKGMVEEASDFLRKARARFDSKLLTRLEVLNVEAQTNQARFQKANSENDLVLARVKFLNRLNLNPYALVEVPATFEEPETRLIELKEVLGLSAQYRSDVQVNALLVKFHEFEERIQKAKGKLQVDLSGFIGASASAFETEKLDAGDDYFIGIKAKKNWGPHGMELSATDTHTSPRLGQTTRTDSTVYTAELGILDKLEGLSEVKQAQVNLEKARRDLDEVKANAFQEVQEAYIGYNKARLQLGYSKQKIRFRKEQVKILKAQASVNEALPSQVLEAVVKLTEERVGQASAMTNYYVALAKLNKAIGLPGRYE